MMSESDTFKSKRKNLKELASLAYQRELEIYLSGLAKAFASWEKGDLSVFELDERIHRYHDGSAREAYKAYTGLKHRLYVARAVSLDILREEEIPPENREEIMSAANFMKGNV